MLSIENRICLHLLKIVFLPTTLFCPPAPEVVARHRYGRPVDCWAVGVIMFIL